MKSVEVAAVRVVEAGTRIVELPKVILAEYANVTDGVEVTGSGAVMTQEAIRCARVAQGVVDDMPIFVSLPEAGVT